nr:hypothetical protein CFP56_64840 [Quercus suber]
MLRFATDSGLVFEEVTVSGVKHKCRNLTPFQRRGRKPENAPPERGTNSLQTTAMRRILCSLERMDELSMSTLPHRIVQEIWQAINRAELQSLHVWKLFIRTDLADAGFTYSWRTGCEQCSLLPRAIDAVVSPLATWLTTLTLQDHVVSPMDMTYIARLTNLRALNIESASLGPRNQVGFLSDGIVRTWAVEAKANAAFQRLEMIFLLGQTRITQWALQCLNDFPALHTFCVSGCGILSMFNDDIARKQWGWHKRPRAEFIKLAKKMSHNNARGLVSWSTLVDVYMSHACSSRVPQIAESPNLNLYVGKTAVNHPNVTSLICFERDWAFAKDKASSAHSSEPELTTRNEITKRRKLRDGKDVALSDMLFDLES